MTARARAALSLALLALAGTLAACGSGAPVAPTGPRASAEGAVAGSTDCDPGDSGSGANGAGDVIVVRTAPELTAALAAARPGRTITLAPGRYAGNFVATTAGSAAEPITLCGPRDAVLDGGRVDSGYTLHLDGAGFWRVRGFAVHGGQKGVVLDGADGVLLDGLAVDSTGDEAVHLRRGSSDNVVRGLTITTTGLNEPEYGEGIYVGSAQGNWCALTSCEPDRADRNLIEGTTISATTAESVDIKEGTTGGTLRGNTFSGAGMTAADAWVDVKGNGWTIDANTGTQAPTDGFQVHEILPGWGLDNTFTANRATVDADGYAVNVTRNADRNRVACDNVAVGAGKGLAREACR